MTDWYYARGGQRVGPLSFESLLELARNGAFAASDLVWHATLPAWTPASEVPGLSEVSFPAPKPPPMAASPDPANPYAAPRSVWVDPAAAASDLGWTEIRPGSDPIDATMCVSRGFDLTKRYFLTIFIIGLVYLGCVFGMSMLVGFIDIAAKMAATGSFEEAAKSQPTSGLMVLSILLQLVSNVVSIFLQLGLIRVGLNLVSGKEVSVGQLFGEGAKLVRAVIASILFGIAMVIGLLLLIVPGVYIALRYGYFITAIVDKDLGIFESFEYSSSITENSRVNLFVLAILNILVVLAGFMACFVGLIFAAPVAWLAGLVAYRWLQYGRDVVHDR